MQSVSWVPAKVSYLERMETVLIAADEYVENTKRLMMAFMTRQTPEVIQKIYADVQDSEITYKSLLRETQEARSKFTPYTFKGYMDEWNIRSITDIKNFRMEYELTFRMFMEQTRIDLDILKKPGSNHVSVIIDPMV